MASDIVRVLRILEYIGPREDVERTLTMGGVPANGQLQLGTLVIRSAVLGQYPEIMGKENDE
jgi:hypothetical protein